MTESNAEKEIPEGSSTTEILQKILDTYQEKYIAITQERKKYPELDDWEHRLPLNESEEELSKDLVRTLDHIDNALENNSPYRRDPDPADDKRETYLQKFEPLEFDDKMEKLKEWLRQLRDEDVNDQQRIKLEEYYKAFLQAGKTAAKPPEPYDRFEITYAKEGPPSLLLENFTQEPIPQVESNHTPDHTPAATAKNVVPPPLPEQQPDTNSITFSPPEYIRRESNFEHGPPLTPKEKQYIDKFGYFYRVRESTSNKEYYPFTDGLPTERHKALALIAVKCIDAGKKRADNSPHSGIPLEDLRSLFNLPKMTVEDFNASFTQLYNLSYDQINTFYDNIKRVWYSSQYFHEIIKYPGPWRMFKLNEEQSWTDRVFGMNQYSELDTLPDVVASIQDVRLNFHREGLLGLGKLNKQSWLINWNERDNGYDLFQSPERIRYNERDFQTGKNAKTTLIITCEDPANPNSIEYSIPIYHLKDYFYDLDDDTHYPKIFQAINDFIVSEEGDVGKLVGLFSTDSDPGISITDEKAVTRKEVPRRKSEKYRNPDAYF